MDTGGVYLVPAANEEALYFQLSEINISQMLRPSLK